MDKQGTNVELEKVKKRRMQTEATTRLGSHCCCIHAQQSNSGSFLVRVVTLQGAPGTAARAHKAHVCQPPPRPPRPRGDRSRPPPPAPLLPRKPLFALF